MIARQLVGRFATLLVVRGALLLLAGAVALRWPEETIAPAMMGASLVQVAAGLWARQVAVPCFAPTIQSGWPAAQTRAR